METVTGGLVATGVVGFGAGAAVGGGVTGRGAAVGAGAVGVTAARVTGTADVGLGLEGPAGEGDEGDVAADDAFGAGAPATAPAGAPAVGWPATVGVGGGAPATEVGPATDGSAPVVGSSAGSVPEAAAPDDDASVARPSPAERSLFVPDVSESFTAGGGVLAATAVISPKVAPVLMPAARIRPAAAAWVLGFFVAARGARGGRGAGASPAGFGSVLG